MNPKIYLDNACTSVVQERTLACAQRYVDLYRNTNKSASDVTRELRGYLADARETVAQFIGCDPDEIALLQCTSHAMGVAANAIPMEKGDNVLICDLEYQASVACWMPRVKRDGIVLREVKSKNGTVSPEDFEEAIDEHTKVIVLASVQEINGFKADVRAITEVAHRHGCLILVDGVQEVGAMKVDVRDYGCDFYCAGGKKWIGNPFGMGFLYIRRELAEELEPMFYSYFNLKTPERFPDYISYLEDPARHPFDDCGVYQDASKFEISAYNNYLGALGLAEALRVQMDLGQEWIEQRIKSMIHRLIDGLGALGIRMCSPTDDAHMSSIASFNFGFVDGKIDLEKKLVSYLQERNIYISLRSSTGTGGLRISVHYYNTPEEIDALVSGISDYMRETGARQERREQA